MPYRIAAQSKTGDATSENLGTASKIGIPIPQTLYARATIIP